MVQREIENILGSRGLDYLVNNAAIALKDDLPSNMDIADLVRTVQTNIGGPAFVTRTIIPLLETHEKWLSEFQVPSEV
ncbi:hypothetical protein OG21DRAFT_1486112 [Imleria badia]|nr:hypothetical protein OG21DRAFT_1486112 [Imleria badia]